MPRQTAWLSSPTAIESNDCLGFCHVSFGGWPSFRAFCERMATRGPIVAIRISGFFCISACHSSYVGNMPRRVETIVGSGQ